MNIYKLNWDIAVDKVHSKIGINVIARDCEGKVIATLRMKMSLFPYPLLAESYGTVQDTIYLWIRAET